METKIFQKVIYTLGLYFFFFFIKVGFEFIVQNLQKKIPLLTSCFRVSRPRFTKTSSKLMIYLVEIKPEYLP